MSQTSTSKLGVWVEAESSPETPQISNGIMSNEPRSTGWLASVEDALLALASRASDAKWVETAAARITATAK